MSMVYWLHADSKHGREETNKDLTCKKIECLACLHVWNNSCQVIIIVISYRGRTQQPALSFPAFVLLYAILL